MEIRVGVLARPHPGPLPPERENRSPRWLQAGAHRPPIATVRITTGNKRGELRWNVQARSAALPLLGERARVRADNLRNRELRRSVIFVERDRSTNLTSPVGATWSHRCRSYGAQPLGFDAMLQRCRPSGASESRASVLDCGSPLPLFHPPRPCESARGLAQSKTSRQKGRFVRGC